MHTICGEPLDRLVRDFLSCDEGIETAVVETAKEFPLAEAVVSIQRAPPGILSVTVSPPLEEGAEAWLVLDRVSVRLEDMLAVPDWAERRSLAARMIEACAAEDADGGNRSVHQEGIGFEGSSRRATSLRAPSGGLEPQAKGALPPFVDHMRYATVRLRIEGEVRLEDHTVTVRGLNVMRRDLGRCAAEWFMF